MQRRHTRARRGNELDATACRGIEHPLRHLERTGNIGLLERAAEDGFFALRHRSEDEHRAAMPRMPAIKDDSRLSNMGVALSTCTTRAVRTAHLTGVRPMPCTSMRCRSRRQPKPAEPTYPGREHCLNRRVHFSPSPDGSARRMEQTLPGVIVQAIVSLLHMRGTIVLMCLTPPSRRSNGNVPCQHYPGRRASYCRLSGHPFALACSDVREGWHCWQGARNLKQISTPHREYAEKNGALQEDLRVFSITESFKERERWEW